MTGQLIAEFEIHSNGIINDRFWGTIPDHLNTKVGPQPSVSITWPCDIRERIFTKVGKYQAFELESGEVEVIYTPFDQESVSNNNNNNNNAVSSIGCIDFSL